VGSHESKCVSSNDTGVLPAPDSARWYWCTCTSHRQTRSAALRRRRRFWPAIPKVPGSAAGVAHQTATVPRWRLVPTLSGGVHDRVQRLIGRIMSTEHPRNTDYRRGVCRLVAAEQQGRRALTRRDHCRRSGRPGYVPVVRPSRNTIRPFTHTVCTPTAWACADPKSARSATVAASNSTRSAK